MPSMVLFKVSGTKKKTVLCDLSFFSSFPTTKVCICSENMLERLHPLSRGCVKPPILMGGERGLSLRGLAYFFFSFIYSFTYLFMVCLELNDYVKTRTWVKRSFFFFSFFFLTQEWLDTLKVDPLRLFLLFPTRTYLKALYCDNIVTIL